MRIVFFTHNAYDMLTGGHQGDTAGGAQLQQILIGKELASRGHDVCFVEYDAEYKTESRVDGIEVTTVPKPAGSAPRRAVQVARGVRQVVRTFDPDICYRRVLDFVVVPLSFFSSVANYQFVYGIAHDDELTDDPHSLTGFKRTRPYLAVNRRALSNAGAVIAQNHYQHKLAETRLQNRVRTIPNCYPDTPAKPIELDYERPIVFWAARFQPWKRPELVVELAEQVPQATFVMAGGPGDSSLYNRIQEKAETLDNLVLTGHIPISEIDRYFASADVFLNTSDEEGFPNTFLQSWVNETPVVSYDVDPNGILQTESIGLVADASKVTLSDHVEKLVTEPSYREKLGKSSRQYYLSNHTVSTIADQYEELFSTVRE